jgi:Resolvase, N terminal domain
MKAIGYVRVSTEKQAEFGVSLEAQEEKVRAMAVVQGAELVDVIVDAGESAKSLNRPGMARLMSLVDAGAVNTVIIAKLDRLTRSVKDLAELLERFTRRGVSLVSVAESLDTGTAAGRLVLNIRRRYHSGSGKPSESGRGTQCTTSGRTVSGWGRSPSDTARRRTACTWKQTRRSKVSCRASGN